MDQVLELKNIHYAYHNPDGETTCHKMASPLS